MPHGSSSPSRTLRSLTARTLRLGAGRCGSEQLAEWAEVQVEVLGGEAEVLAQLGHALLEREEGLAEALDLLRCQVARIDAAQGLALHELAQELDNGEEELREPLLDALGVGVDAAGKRVVEPGRGGGRAR